jgi:hypothetical protein
MEMHVRPTYLGEQHVKQRRDRLERGRASSVIRTGSLGAGMVAARTDDDVGMVSGGGEHVSSGADRLRARPRAGVAIARPARIFATPVPRSFTSTPVHHATARAIRSHRPGPAARGGSHDTPRRTSDHSPAREPAGGESRDVGSLDAIIAALYDVISGPAGQQRNWDRMRSLFIPGARLIPAHPPGWQGRPRVLDVDGYIGRAGPTLEKNGFFEREISRKTDSFGTITHAFSTYESRRTKEDAKAVRPRHQQHSARERRHAVVGS